MEKNNNGSSVSSKKLDANRRNARLSTGPKTEQGRAEFDELLRSLHEDLLPVGVLEKMLVEKIAVFWWRQRRALQCEAGLVERAFVPIPETDIQFLSRTIGVSSRAPEQEAIKSHLRLPLGEDLDCILRYETTMQRQLVHAINQLERLQRARKGEQIPAPVNVQISNES